MARGALDSAEHPARERRHPGPHRQVGEHEPGHRWWQVGCTREILRRAEPDRSRRPHVHAG